ncbi:hypothetical protein O181_065329 [Austropuccinia psidii MF-1]|uniref:alpha-1,2-Mannosidase n=1 Tax=Austropuccinia psidii MF-1 TaxID=1389203 RepID=A0A9Q3EQV0_9BASI|nr:hypothetical protein [Austropuccinia psidii MF-1]
MSLISNLRQRPNTQDNLVPEQTSLSINQADFNDSKHIYHKKNSSSSFKFYFFSLLTFSFSCYFIYSFYLNYQSKNPTSSSDLNQINTFKTYPPPILPWNSHPRLQIINAIKQSWLAYANSPAWGSDEFYVLTQTGGNLTKSGSIGFFIVDVLDTLLLTNQLDDQYKRARNYIQNHLHFEIDGDLNAFEVTIRVLGGLLSAYHLSGFDQLYLEKALDLGQRLLPIFNSPTGIPYSFINLKTGKAKADMDNNGFSSLAEATTLQLEFKYLAHISQKKVFWDVAEKAMAFFKTAPSHNGLFPILVSPEHGSFFYDIRLGSRGDSYYEYLIKQYLQTNRTQTIYKEMYDQAMTGIKEELVKETPNGLVYTGELHSSGSSYVFEPKQDHLVCFLGGSFLLGVTEGRGPLSEKQVLSLSDSNQEDWLLGKELIRTCVNTYEKSATKLGPEIVHFFQKPQDANEKSQRDWIIPHYNSQSPPLDARNILRPETVESLFLAWRATHDPIYREWGWQIFQAFNEHCKLESNGAYASIKDVDKIPAEHENKMETFWLAETLKYLLLLFSDDDQIPLELYVLNTEAHIFPPPSSKFKPPVVLTALNIFLGYHLIKLLVNTSIDVATQTPSEHFVLHPG